jgi:phosphoribosylformimino-5-aminoimidazole carboxamide ribotide isomerase
MIVYPAVDVKGGSVVRLLRGDPSEARAYSEDPSAVASEWKAQGAEWIHLVSLDAAIDACPPPLDLIAGIAGLGIRVQYGGGLRTVRDAVAALRAGASRVVLGTLAVSDPGMAGRLARLLGRDAVSVALDMKGGRAASSGWRCAVDRTLTDLAVELACEGVANAVYTIVERDGTMTGADLEGAEAIAVETGMSVTVSGGVGSLQEMRRLGCSARISGVIVGRALYERAFTLREALDAVSRKSAAC